MPYPLTKKKKNFTLQLRNNLNFNESEVKAKFKRQISYSKRNFRDLFIFTTISDIRALFESTFFIQIHLNLPKLFGLLSLNHNILVRGIL